MEYVFSTSGISILNGVIMEHNNRRPFISLYWKATSGLALVFLSLIFVYSYFSANQLTSMQSNYRAHIQHQYVIEYTGLLKSSETQLISIIDSLHILEAKSDHLVDKIQKNWLLLQINWGLESAVLVNKDARVIQQWGDKRIKPSLQIIKRIIESSAPIQKMTCLESCFLTLSAPILNEKGEIQVLQISVSMADIMLNFKAITNTDIGILTKTKIDKTYPKNKHTEVFGATGLAFSALTNKEIIEPMLNRFATNNAGNSLFSKIFQGDDSVGNENIYVLDTPMIQHEVMFFSTPEMADNNAMVVFISDTTTERDQIIFARQNYFTVGVISSIVAIGVIILLLWRPIASLRRQSQALPLLPLGKYKEAKKRLSKMAKHRLFSDEISHLQETSLAVTGQLEDYHFQLTKNSEKLYEMAHFDSLTGLINRVYLTEIIDQKLASQDENENNFGLIYLDLDNFKHINDALGHVVGDNLLTIIAKRLKACIGPNDFAARTGGDEFCIILSQCFNDSSAIDFANRILHIMEEPVAMGGRNLAISTSIGIALSSLDGSSADVLLQNADLAMYEAKAAGKNKYHVFNNQLHKNADSRMSLELELRKAVENNEFVLHYQPQIDLNTGMLIGCEALIRWQHPERGLLAPFFFIDTIESNGLIIPVGKWIIQEACRQCGEWSRKGLDNIKMSINLSVRQFSDPDLVKDINAAISDAQIKPEQIELEVTESLLATDIKRAIELLKELQSQGMTIAIDDFGTGYSSLSYLKQLPLDKLKVDRAFVMDIPQNQDDKLITNAIIAMAHTLNLKVVAEGVETREQMEFLQQKGCEIGQGYLFNKPLSPEQFIIEPIAKGSFSPLKQLKVS